MTLLVDTSVWSLSLRRNPVDSPEVTELRRALAAGDLVATTGIIIQELLQGPTADSSRATLRDRLSRIMQVTPTLADHVEAAENFVACRQRGLQLGTVDALLATLCIRRGLTLLTSDRDFLHARDVLGLRVWQPN